jgi:beta-mannosidase
LDASKSPKASWYAVKNAYAENATNQIDSILPKDWKLLKPSFKITQVDKTHFSITSNVEAKFVYLSLNDNPLKCSDNYFDLSKDKKKIISIDDLSLIKKLENFNIFSLFDVLNR